MPKQRKDPLPIRLWIAIWSFSTLVFVPAFCLGFAIFIGYDPANWSMSRFECWLHITISFVFVWAFGIAVLFANMAGNKWIGPNGEKLFRRHKKDAEHQPPKHG